MNRYTHTFTISTQCHARKNGKGQAQRAWMEEVRPNEISSLFRLGSTVSKKGEILPSLYFKKCGLL